MGLDREVVWWWKTLWKIKCPPKNKLFMWFVLENKAPTWDNLQKRSFQGPGWYSLCKGEYESVIHLFLHCSYTLAVWKECTKHFGINCVWRGYTILLAWEQWRRTCPNGSLNALPLLVIWGIWLAHNNLIFSDKCCTPEITASLTCGIMEAFPHHIKARQQR